MTITEILDQLYDQIDDEGIELSDFGIHYEDDLKVFALNYLMSNTKEAFEDPLEDSNDW